MSMRFKYALIGLSVLILFGLVVFELRTPNLSLPVVTIANYGPHSSLDETVRGIKEGLEARGFKENETVFLKVSNVNFDHSLISQMISKLKASRPKVMVALATPIAQALKNSQKEVPIVFAAITDPVDAGLIVHPEKSHENVTGASDKQNLDLFLIFAKQLLPEAQTIGLLYATGDANDLSLVTLMERSAQKMGLKVIAIPVDQARDIPQRMQGFKNNVDFLYVGTSGPIQPALPTIVAEADRMNIPVFNADSEAVRKNQVLGSYGVTYHQVGINAAELVANLLNGKKIDDLPPLFPSEQDHHGFVSRKQAEKFGIRHFENLQNVTIVE